MYTQKNTFKILLNQPEIRLYLPFSDWFGTKRTSFWCLNQSENGKYNMISGWFNKILKRFFCVYGTSSPSETFSEHHYTMVPLYYRASLKLPIHHCTLVPRGLSGTLKWGSIYASLGQLKIFSESGQSNRIWIVIILFRLI